jgi:Circadian oscillating protein COP23
MSFRSLPPIIVRSSLLTAAGLAMTASLATPAIGQDVVIPTAGDTTVSTTSTGGISTGTTGIPSTGGVPLNSVRFFCATENGRPTVMYQPEDQAGSRYAWAVPQQMGGGWTPERRCGEIASRLESYRPDGLVEMQTSVENGYNTVCVTTDKVPSCRIVFTVPKGQDPISTRDQVFQNLAIADSGQRTAGVFTLRDQNPNLVGQLGKALKIDLNGLGGLLGKQSPAAASAAASVAAPSHGIYLKPFLSRADGGTGAQLKAIVAPKVQATPPAAKPASKGKLLRRVFR